MAESYVLVVKYRFGAQNLQAKHTILPFPKCLPPPSVNDEFEYEWGHNGKKLLLLYKKRGKTPKQRNTNDPIISQIIL